MDHIRRLENKKMKESGINKKSPRWKELKVEVEEKVSDANNAHYEREVKKIHGGEI